MHNRQDKAEPFNLILAYHLDYIDKHIPLGT